MPDALGPPTGLCAARKRCFREIRENGTGHVYAWVGRHFQRRQYAGRRLKWATAKTNSSTGSARYTTENGKPFGKTRRVHSFHGEPSFGCAEARAVAATTDSRN